MALELYVNTTAKLRFIFDVFYDLTIKLKGLKKSQFCAKIPNSRGMGHRPKIVKKSPRDTCRYVKESDVGEGFCQSLPLHHYSHTGVI